MKFPSETGRHRCLAAIVSILVLLVSDAGASNWADLTAQAKLDSITALPGQPPVPFAQFSGYVPVGRGNKFFYYLTEAALAASSKPLVLWLNGGPGCSSFGYGALEELGPFRVAPSGESLFLNEYAWNTLANILFLESPAGVGFSYSNSSTLTTGDAQTAADNLQFLLSWFERFPQYKYRDFYIAGQSYAGHYVPQLAKLLYEKNKNIPKPSINLKGILVGNGVTDNNADSRGTVDFWWSHAIMSDATYNKVQANCDFTSKAAQPNCTAVIGEFFQTEFGNIDVDGIYLPICISPAASTTTYALRPLGRLLQDVGQPSAAYDSCKDNHVQTYLNRPDVQHALHANTTGIPYPWVVCSRPVNNNYTRDDSVLPIYQELIQAGLRIWVYNGDTDAAVPVTATRYSLNVLNLPVKTKWYPWYHQKEVGGWSIQYDGITYVTVRGAGHLVPTTKPSQALALATSFLTGQLLPATP